MAKVLCLAIVCALGAAAQTVEGTVYDAATGAPVSGVKVELLKSTTPFYETASDGGGRFRFSVPEGDYSIRYQSPDYFLTGGPTDYKAFHVGPGDPVTRDMQLLPWSRISGRVVDSGGNAVPNAPVTFEGLGMTLNGRTYLRTPDGGGGGGPLSDAPRAMGLALHAKSDAFGNFQLRLMPGSYEIAAAPPPGLKPPIREADGPALAWTASRRTNIVALPGAEVSGVELKLIAVPTRSVRGMVLYPDGSPAAKVTVGFSEGAQRRTAVCDDGGRFTFGAVAEGGWSFVAETDRAGVRLRARARVEVAAHEIEKLEMRLAAPIRLRGRVIMEGSNDPPVSRPLVLALRDGGDDRGMPGPGSVPIGNSDQNGEFRVPLYPGAYGFGVQLQAQGGNSYLAAVKIGEADLLRQDVEIAADAEIRLIYKSDGGAVTGTVEHCDSGGVMLVPEDVAQRGRGFSRSGPCDASGHFEAWAVPPGAYYAMAFAGNSMVAPVDEAMIRKSARVEVRAREVSTVDPPVVARPVY